MSGANRTSVIKWLTMLLLISPAVASDRNFVGKFSSGELADWQEKSFSGHTGYRIVTEQGRQVLRADSHAAASGFVRKVRIDLYQTPYLNWSWKLKAPLTGLDEQTRNGDDYAARMYVIVNSGWRFWKSRALNYVWSGSQPTGSSWPNAFSGQTVMLAVESGATHAGQWRSYKRNIQQDLKTYLGNTPRYIDAVAIMTDTDNSGKSAMAWYGDIWFSSK